jgi:galactonate dehydratase
MKIVDIRPMIVNVSQRGNWVFVLVETNEGITGVGEASHSGNDKLIMVELNRLRDKLNGFNPLNIEIILKRLKTRRMVRSRMRQIALSAIEQALWDIMGKHLNVPIHTLFGGALRNKIRLYANINRSITDRTPAGFAKAACRAVDEGFTAIKIAPFDEITDIGHIRTGPRAAWRPGVDRVRKTREAIGDDIELAVDCHGRMDVSEAVMVAESMADYNLLWLEEPVPRDFSDGLKIVVSRVAMPVADGEYLFGVEGFRSLLTDKVVDIIMPDVKWNGGLLETKLIAGAARVNQTLVAPHNPAGPVSTAASAQVASTLSNFLILEYAWGEVQWRTDLLEPPETVQDGYLIVSDRPGLGHRLNEAVLKNHVG